MKRKFLALILTIVSVFTVFAIANKDSKEAEAAADQYIYLKPSSEWKKDGARFAAYFFGNGEKWVSMSKAADDLYYVKVEAGYPNVIFCRMNGGNSTNNWSNKWNQTADLTVPTNNEILFSVSGWGGGKWSAPSVYMMGTMTDWTNGVTMTNDGTNYTFSKTIETAGEYQFKIKVAGVWVGASHFTVAGLSSSKNKDDNCIVQLEKGDYVFNYNLATKTVNVTFTAPKVDPNDAVKNLTSTYYNNGTYTRKTNIFLNDDARKEMVLFFHANCTILERTTYFTPDALWMSTEENEQGEMVYSYYGSQGGNLTWTQTTSALTEPTSHSVAVKETSMEAYYTTMKDISELNVIWSEESTGVYASADPVAIQAFLDFTAPCFLGVGENNKNYFSLSKVTIEETEEGLVLKLWTTGDQGKLSGTANLLSQAIITK